MSEKIRVLHVFAALDSGGVSNFVMNMYREIDTERIQFDFALTAGKKTLYDAEVLSRGGRIFYFDLSKSITTNLRQILRETGPYYVIHSHLFFYSGLVLKEAKRAGIPIRIAHAHNAHTGENLSLMRVAYERIMRFLIHSYATNMLGCSEKACCYVFGKNAMNDSRTSIMPDGIDYARFAFNPQIRELVRKEYGLEGKFVVGHVGHFNAAKNHDKILSVFAEVCLRKDNAALLLVGDGELEQEVRNRTIELGLTEKIVFAGAHKDVERLYQAMDVFLFPSRYEGFGMAIIEAQASGLFCVASDFVPKETDLGNCIYLSLSAGDDTWASILLNSKARNNREKMLQVKNQMKYDVKNATEKMQSIYVQGMTYG